MCACLSVSVCNSNEKIGVVKILRVLRVLRPLRAINRAKGLKVCDWSFILPFMSFHAHSNVNQHKTPHLPVANLRFSLKDADVVASVSFCLFPFPFAIKWSLPLPLIGFPSSGALLL